MCKRDYFVSILVLVQFIWLSIPCYCNIEGMNPARADTKSTAGALYWSALKNHIHGRADLATKDIQTALPMKLTLTTDLRPRAGTSREIDSSHIIWIVWMQTAYAGGLLECGQFERAKTISLQTLKIASQAMDGISSYDADFFGAVSIWKESMLGLQGIMLRAGKTTEAEKIETYIKDANKLTPLFQKDLGKYSELESKIDRLSAMPSRSPKDQKKLDLLISDWKIAKNRQITGWVAQWKAMLSKQNLGF